MKSQLDASNLFLQLEYGIVDEKSGLRQQMSLSEFKRLFDKTMVNATRYDYNLLEISVLARHFDIVAYLLTFRGWNINHQNQNGETVLQFVSDKAVFSFDSAFKLLSYSGVDTSVVDMWGNNPLWTVLYNMYYQRIDLDLEQQYIDWLKALVDFGFKFNNRSVDVIHEKMVSESWLKQLFD